MYLIKSIQMHDDPVEESVCPARVGLAVKGAKPDEVGRGDVISEEGVVDVKTEIEIDFQKVLFTKVRFQKIKDVLSMLDCKSKQQNFRQSTPLKLVFEKPIVCKKGQIAVILKPESPTIRILGSGQIQ